MTDEEKKRHGGKRPGSGPKAQMLRIGRKFTIQVGQTVLVHSRWPEGRTMMRKAVVELEGHSRNRTIEFHCDDGEVIVIAMIS